MLKPYKNFDVNYFPEHELVLWKIKSEGIPNFSIDKLREFKRFSEDLKVMFADENYPLKYIVSGSDCDGIYNLGGDLPYFYGSILNRDRAKLEEYAHLCIDAIYNMYCSFDLPAITIATVEGKAYGGGFECVMAHDVIIADAQAQFCLPENKFNLFPGMGAYSFLCRKLNINAAMEILYSGSVYGAEELGKKGLIDRVIASENTLSSVVQYIEENRSNFNFQSAHYKSIKRVFPLQKSELLDITNIWVDSCMQMEQADLRRMELIINAQQRRMGIKGYTLQ
jgi:DSF synthase